MKEDGSLWKWEMSEGESGLVEVDKDVAHAAAANFYLTDTGKLFVDSTASILPKPIVAIVPYLRNTIILLCGLLLITGQRNKETV